MSDGQVISIKTGKLVEVIGPGGCLTEDAIYLLSRGELSPEAEKVANHHMSSCEFCRDAAEGFGHLPTAAYASTAVADLNTKVAKRAGMVKGKKVAFEVKRYLAAAAILVILGGTIFFILEKVNSPGENLMAVEEVKKPQAKKEKIAQKQQNGFSGFSTNEEPLVVADSVENNNYSGGTLFSLLGNNEANEDFKQSGLGAGQDLLALNREKEAGNRNESRKDKNLESEIKKLDNKSILEEESEKEILDTDADGTADFFDAAPSASGGNLMEDDVVETASADVYGEVMLAESVSKTRSAKAKEAQSSEVFSSVEQMPVFPGGNPGLISYLSKNIEYPKRAANKEIEGTVYVSFVVDRDGRPSAIQIQKGVQRDLDRAAVSVVSNMPSWTPGRQNGQVVPVRMTLPVKFELGE